MQSCCGTCPIPEPTFPLSPSPAAASPELALTAGAVVLPRCRDLPRLGAMLQGQLLGVGVGWHRRHAGKRGRGDKPRAGREGLPLLTGQAQACFAGWSATDTLLPRAEQPAGQDSSLRCRASERRSWVCRTGTRAEGEKKLKREGKGEG